MALINKEFFRTATAIAGLALGVGLVSPAAAASPDGVALIRERCLSCHTEQAGAEAKFSRISGQRKSPEGWQMTLNRMQHHRGLQLSADEKRVLIKHLADRQGLAPEEAAPWRYLLEQDVNRVESLDPAYTQMCARCHSGARFALQRRSEEEWRLLIHFHMGQHPTLELHAMSRDRPWMQLALNETAPQLAKDFPLVSEAWQNWQKAAKPDLGGSWRVIGYVPGKGEFDARMKATPAAADHFAVTLDGRYLDGSPMRGEGTATVYTGYEWRAALTVDGVRMRQVLAASADGQSMAGRQFGRDARSVGGELRAVRESDTANVIAVLPAHLRSGARATLTVIGSRLDGELSLGEGVRIVEVVSRSPERIVVLAEAAGAPGLRDVKVGAAAGPGLLAVYDRIARIEVSPADALARIGGAEGDPAAQMDKVPVVFRAVGYAAGPDGKPGTEDDLRLGHVPVQWAIEPANEAAEKEKDHLFAGAIDAHGVFTPGDAAPNPKRHMSANNVGMLKVVATADDGAGAAVRADANLLVAVPDFVRRVLD